MEFFFLFRFLFVRGFDTFHFYLEQWENNRKHTFHICMQWLHKSHVLILYMYLEIDRVLGFWRFIWNVLKENTTFVLCFSPVILVIAFWLHDCINLFFCVFFFVSHPEVDVSGAARHHGAGKTVTWSSCGVSCDFRCCLSHCVVWFSY